jgi:hypothetical protein
MARQSWGSKLGGVMAVAGSAIMVCYTCIESWLLGHSVFALDDICLCPRPGARS